MEFLQLQIADCLLSHQKYGQNPLKYSWKYLFMFCWRKKCIQIRNDMKVRNWLQIFYFWMNDSFIAWTKWSVQTKASCECELLFTKLYMSGKQKWAACDCGLMWGWISSSCSIPPVSPRLTSSCPGQLHSRPQRRSEAAICLDKPLIPNAILLGFTWWQNPLFNSFTPHGCAL